MSFYCASTPKKAVLYERGGRDWPEPISDVLNSSQEENSWKRDLNETLSLVSEERTISLAKGKGWYSFLLKRRY